MIKAACTSPNQSAGCFCNFKRLFIVPQKFLTFVFTPPKAACTSKCPAELDKHVAFAVGIEKMVAADTLPHTDDLRGDAGKLDFAVRHGHAGEQFAVVAQDAEPVCGMVTAAADADMGGGGEPGRPSGFRQPARTGVGLPDTRQAHGAASWHTACMPGNRPSGIIFISIHYIMPHLCPKESKHANLCPD